MPDASFVHLHVHTHFSLLDGACRIPRLAEQAAEWGMPALAKTDHGNLFGTVPFYTTVMAAGLKPIIGYEAYLAPRSRTSREAQDLRDGNHHLTLLARNERGYQNLIHLSTAAYLEGFYAKPRVDRELLEQYAGGLLALSGCLKSELAGPLLSGNRARAREIADWHVQTFGQGHYYFELMSNSIPEQKRYNEALLELSREMGIPIVATNDVHYLSPDDVKAHEILLCIHTGKTLADEQRMRFAAGDFYFKSPEQMAEEFSGQPEALRNTLEVASHCNVQLSFSERHFPHFQPEDGSLPADYLRRLCRAGLLQHYGDPSPDPPRERLDYELGVIEQKGYVGYFLIAWDFVRFAKERGIPISMRGSGAASIVSYTLGLTDIDPLKHDLLFQRFLPPERKEPPDIDMDFCEHGREEVMNYVRQKYGEENTAHIISFGTLKARAAVRDVGRVLGIPLPEVGTIAKLIPSVLGTKLADALENTPELKQLYQTDPRMRELFDIALRLEGLHRHPSIHAAGMVIADRPLTHYLPLCRVSDTVATQFPMNDLDKIGMLKMDFLGVRFLTIVEETLKLVKQTRGEELDLAQLPFDDRATYELLSRGEGRGVFQVGSDGMRSLLQRLQPDQMDDIIAVVALYRPGPLQSGAVEEFIDRKHGRTPVDYLHPMLEPIARSTYGILMYQEQIMQVAHQMGGLTLSDALTMVKAISKKQVSVFQRFRQQFLENAVAQGVEQSLAESIFDVCQLFAGYGFNKAHTTAYAYLTYRTAYLKAHYPVEFLAATLTCEMDNTDKVEEFIEECRRMKIELLPPSVNQSRSEFCVVDGKIRFGLAAIKNVGRKSIEALVEARDQGEPFADLFDLCERVDLHAMNRQTLESLIKAGALDDLPGRRAQLAASLDDALQVGGQLQRDRQRGQATFFGAFKEQAPAQPRSLRGTDEWTEGQELAYEKEVLGFYMSSHPLAKHEEQIRAFANATTLDLDNLEDNTQVILGGLLADVEARQAQNGRFKGRTYARFTLEDLDGSCGGVMFSQEYERYQQLLQPERIVFIKGAVSHRGNRPSIRASEVVSLAAGPQQLATAVEIRLDQATAGHQMLESIRNLLADHPGNCSVVLSLPAGGGKTKKLRVSRRLYVQPSKALGQSLSELIGNGRVQYHGPERVKLSPGAADFANGPDFA